MPRKKSVNKEAVETVATTTFEVLPLLRKKLLRSMHATIDDAIDRAGLPLLGVVPEDDSLPLSLNQGMPPLPPQASAAAYRNIAHRLQGQRVPLLRIK